MANNSEGNLLFLIVGVVIGVITGAIFFAVKNEWIAGMFGSGYTSFLISFAVCLFVFSIGGLGIGWLFCVLRK